MDKAMSEQGKMTLRLIENEQSIIEAALAIAEEREKNTRDLCRAVLTKDYFTAQKIAKELLPNEKNDSANPREHRSASR